MIRVASDSTSLAARGATPLRVLRGLLKTMRPRQWTKNSVLLAGVIFDQQLSISHPIPLFRSLAGMVLFCLLSSTVYIINDLVDINADRAHPQKRNRPLASGALPVPVAIIAAVLLVVITFPIAYLLSPEFAAVCAGYFVLNLLYSFWIKHFPILDVLSLAAGFVLRVAGGVLVITVARFSPWLYVVTTLLALYLGFGKRRAELSLLAEGATSHRRVLDGYTIPLLDQFLTIVSSTTIISYSLYTFTAPNLPANHVMMLTIPFALYGIFRYLYLVQIKKGGGVPEEMLLSDRPLQISIFLWGLTVFLIFYIFNFSN